MGGLSTASAGHLPRDCARIHPMRRLIVCAALLLSGCGSAGATRTVVETAKAPALKAPPPGPSVTLPSSLPNLSLPPASTAADPAGYPVECDQGNVCYQLGHRVDFDPGGAITASEAAACAGKGPGYIWESQADPVPGAPPTALTYDCGAPH